jgi:hypothetical protein
MVKSRINAKIFVWVRMRPPITLGEVNYRIHARF